MNDYLINIDNISYKATENTFLGKAKEKLIIKEVSFDLQNKEVISIIGESGSGKTTLAKLIMGIILPDIGIIEYNKEFIEKNKIQILFQNNEDIINPLRSVDHILEESISIVEKEDIVTPKENLMRILNIEDKLLVKKGYQLSGGEKQRVALARILSVEPRVIILDEPFSAQDVESQLGMIELIKKLNKDKGISIICISHQINLLKHFSDRTIVLNEGSIVEIGQTEEILNSPKIEFTKNLLAAEKLI